MKYLSAAYVVVYKKIKLFFKILYLKEGIYFVA